MQLRERLAQAGVAGLQRRIQPKELNPPAGFSRGINAFGEVVYRDRYLALDHRHGRIRLDSALSLSPNLLGRLGEGLTQEHVHRAAFLDIETTGLSGGTGTYAFLVGVGTFDGLSFRVRQFFLSEPGGERAMLSAVAETVERCECLVTYNGKSFDIPQLNTRYALARLAPPADGLPHIDLLHPARRLFARRLESCRLADLERELIGLHRFGEPPSWMIPELYFAYVRRRDAGGLHPVFEHNHLDVVSLVAVLAHLDRVAGRSTAGDAASLLGIARWDEARGRLDEAIGHYEAAWRRDAEGDDGAFAALRLARLRRRRGEWAGCEEVWLQELRSTRRPQRRVRACEELAKLAEHWERLPEKALELTTEALALAQSRGTPPMPETLQRLERRAARLRRRLKNEGRAT
jgi:hypothetical protein